MIGEAGDRGDFQAEPDEGVGEAFGRAERDRLNAASAANALSFATRLSFIFLSNFWMTSTWRFTVPRSSDVSTLRGSTPWWGLSRAETDSCTAGKSRKR